MPDGMKTALHSVSYAGVWPGQVCLGLEAIIEKARRFGFDGLMLMAKRPHASPLDLDAPRRKELRALLEDAGLSLACLAAYNDFTAGAERPDVPLLEAQIVYIEQLARLAADLGGNLVRVFTGYEHPALSHSQSWQRCVAGLKDAARRAADSGVTLAVQNHHDIANHHDALLELLSEIDEPNCQAAFDAWAPALQGADLAEAVRKLGSRIVHTTVADYVRRPRFRYESSLVNFLPQPPAVSAVPMGQGIVNYPAFFKALSEVGYNGFAAYEMCSPLRGGGSEDNLDRCARRFLEYMTELSSELPGRRKRGAAKERRARPRR
jgi:sugar phosphate isomerase/epimerase